MALDNHNEMRALFLDISKAFDKFCHSGLTFKFNKIVFAII